MGKKSRQKARVAVYSRNVVSPWGLLLQSCAVQVPEHNVSHTLMCSSLM